MCNSNNIFTYVFSSHLTVNCLPLQTEKKPPIKLNANLIFTFPQGQLFDVLERPVYIKEGFIYTQGYVYVLLLCMPCYVYFVFIPATLTDVFPCFSLSCKANARVYLAKTGHGPHSSQLVNCVVPCIVSIGFF